MWSAGGSTLSIAAALPQPSTSSLPVARQPAPSQPGPCPPTPCRCIAPAAFTTAAAAALTSAHCRHPPAHGRRRCCLAALPTTLRHRSRAALPTCPYTSPRRSSHPCTCADAPAALRRRPHARIHAPTHARTHDGSSACPRPRHHHRPNSSAIDRGWVSSGESGTGAARVQPGGGGRAAAPRCPPEERRCDARKTLRHTPARGGRPGSSSLGAADGVSSPASPSEGPLLLKQRSS